MADAAYEAAVKLTFETKPLRTVLLIDDEFPSYADLAHGETRDNRKKFVQKYRALQLYEGFRDRKMICDCENDVTDLHIERFRKSDLIILDYHLGPGDDDSQKAIDLLRTLSSSKHFNTVLLYTAEPRLNEVWLDIMASLSGGWNDFVANLEGCASHHWHRLDDEDKLPSASLDATIQFARRQHLRDLTQDVREAAERELIDVDVPLNVCGDIIKAMIHREMSHRAGKYASVAPQRAEGDCQQEVRWIQCNNSFVAILKKDDRQDGNDTSERLMSYLNRALLAWRPNLFHILVSEVQNILDLEALATTDELLCEATTHTALWYYLLETLGPINPTSASDVRAPLVDIIDKVVDGIRRRLCTDSELLNLASNVLLGELKDVGWTDETWPRRGQKKVRGAFQLTRTKGIVQPQDVLFRLNRFFSTEVFRHPHLTTGTIFLHRGTSEYFVTASPACDLIARQPGHGQSWAHSIHPLTPIVAILLHVGSIDSALTKATRARHIFLECDNEKLAFKIVNESGQPSYEFFFARNEGKIRDADGKRMFDAARLMPTDGDAKPTDSASEVRGDDRNLVYQEFEIVGQLRNINAAQVLQMAGQHLSRIGLDFLDMPVN